MYNSRHRPRMDSWVLVSLLVATTVLAAPLEGEGREGQGRQAGGSNTDKCIFLPSSSSSKHCDCPELPSKVLYSVQAASEITINNTGM